MFIYTFDVVTKIMRPFFSKQRKSVNKFSQCQSFLTMRYKICVSQKMLLFFLILEEMCLKCCHIKDQNMSLVLIIDEKQKILVFQNTTKILCQNESWYKFWINNVHSLKRIREIKACPLYVLSSCYFLWRVYWPYFAKSINPLSISNQNSIKQNLY